MTCLLHTVKTLLRLTFPFLMTVQVNTPVSSRIKDIQKDQRRRHSIIEDRRQRLSDSIPSSLTQSPISTLSGHEAPKTLSEQELQSSFDEWMKIVADNVN